MCALPGLIATQPNRVRDQRQAEEQRGRFPGQVGVRAQAQSERDGAQAETATVVGVVPFRCPDKGSLADPDEILPVDAPDQQPPRQTAGRRVAGVHDWAPPREESVQLAAVGESTHDAENDDSAR